MGSARPRDGLERGRAVKFRVAILDQEAIEVDLPPLHPGEAARAVVGGKTVDVALVVEADGERALLIGGERYAVHELPPPSAGSAAQGAAGGVQGPAFRFLHRGWPITARVESENDRLKARARERTSHAGPHTVTSPLPGAVRRVFVSPGAVVQPDSPVVTLDAMKMENEVRADRHGRVAEVYVQPGQVVNAGDRLVRIELE